MFTAIFNSDCDDSFFIVFVINFYKFSLLSDSNFDSFWVECHSTKEKKKLSLEVPLKTERNRENCHENIYKA